MGVLRGGRASVLAVVVALLLCHGAFGYAHQLPATETHAAHAVHTAHTAGGHNSVPDGETDGAHQGAYFATLLALLFGTVLLLGGRGWARVRLSVPAVPRHGRKTAILHPPRGPTLPSLQVFRL